MQSYFGLNPEEEAELVRSIENPQPFIQPAELRVLDEVLYRYSKAAAVFEVRRTTQEESPGCTRNMERNFE